MTSNAPPPWRDLMANIPFNRELGIEFDHVDGLNCALRLPYRDALASDLHTQSTHGGALAALADNTFGFAVFRRLATHRAFATLDLRIDYMRPSQSGAAVTCVAYCHEVSDQFAFVRGYLYDDTPDRPIATAVGVFIFTSGLLPNAPEILRDVTV